MAVHASAGGWDAGETRLLHRGVTVAAVDTQPGHMVLVTEGYRLRLHDAGIGDVGRSLELHQRIAQAGNDEDRAVDRCPGECVGAALKDLHRTIVFNQAGGRATSRRMVCPVCGLQGDVIRLTKTCDYNSC